MTMPTMPGSNPAVESEISSKATTSLVTGILGIFCCALLGIWAIIAGNQAQALIAQTGMGQQHATKANIGKILGIVALVLWAIGLVLRVVLNVGGGVGGLQE